MAQKKSVTIGVPGGPKINIGALDRHLRPNEARGSKRPRKPRDINREGKKGRPGIARVGGGNVGDNYIWKNPHAGYGTPRDVPEALDDRRFKPNYSKGRRGPNRPGKEEKPKLIRGGKIDPTPRPKPPKSPGGKNQPRSIDSHGGQSVRPNPWHPKNEPKIPSGLKPENYSPLDPRGRANLKSAMHRRLNRRVTT